MHPLLHSYRSYAAKFAWTFADCACAAGRGAIKVHGGFYNGAKRHLAEIATVVRACDEKAGVRLPVWVTGHSLGGGYANALALHLLAQRNTAELFGAGAPVISALEIWACVCNWSACMACGWLLRCTAPENVWLCRRRWHRHIWSSHGGLL